MKAWYDKDEKNMNKYKYFIMLDLEKRNDLKEFVRGDKLMEKYKDELLELNSDEEFVSKYTREEEFEIMKNTAIDIAREEGIEQGIQEGIQEGTKQNSLEIAKELLALDTISIEQISKITKLSLNEIKKLKEIV